MLQNLTYSFQRKRPREIVYDNLKRNGGKMKKNNLSESLHWTTQDKVSREWDTVGQRSQSGDQTSDSGEI